MNIDLNFAFQHALNLMENGSTNLFITGRAGTGKSTLLTYFKAKTPKKIAVLAPTGVAALNVQGQTIHSFFKFKPGVTVQSLKKLEKKKDRNLYAGLETIIIDEISMVRADLLDCIDHFLRLNGKDPQKPFGGIQMIFIGDLYQLPPVVNTQEKDIFQRYYKSPYFFSAQFFETFQLEFVELDKIYRQKDTDFIHLLNAIRNQTFTPEDIAKLNKRVVEDFDPPEDDYYVYLTPYTLNAQSLNEDKLEKLQGKLHQFQAIVEGEFKQDNYPAPPLLCLRPHAQIMMINNDPRGRWVNGTMGKILSIQEKEGKETIVVKLETHEKVYITPNTWEINQFYLEEEHVKTKVIGTFTQYPLVLAWALTIHKSQGKTFEKVVLDIGKGAFTPGQVYVALSRCTSLEGLVLKKPIQQKHMWINPEIVEFLKALEFQNAERKFPLEKKVNYLYQAIKTQTPLTLIYRKADDEKVTVHIKPIRLAPMTYRGEGYLGLEGIFQEIDEISEKNKRVFKVDRIIDIICSTVLSGKKEELHNE